MGGAINIRLVDSQEAWVKFCLTGDLGVVTPLLWVSGSCLNVLIWKLGTSTFISKHCYKNEKKNCVWKCLAHSICLTSIDFLLSLPASLSLTFPLEGRSGASFSLSSTLGSALGTQQSLHPCSTNIGPTPQVLVHCFPSGLYQQEGRINRIHTLRCPQQIDQ